MRAVPSAVVATGLLFFAVPASAEESALRLTWSAPTECPSSDRVHAAAMRTVDDRSRRDGVLEADAHVERAASARWRVRLKTKRGADAGEREIEAPTCEGVAEATAVVLSLALAPPGPAVEEEPPVADAPPAVPVAAERRATSSAKPRDDGHALAVGLSAATDTVTLPSAALGGSVTVAWTPGRARIELDARRWAAQSTTVAGSTAGARFTVTSLGARGCWAMLTGNFELGPCAGADAQLVSAPGFGADTNHAPDASWASLTGGALARLPLATWVSLRARAEAAMPLARPTFIVENTGQVFRPAAVGVAASLGLEAHFL